MVYFSSAAQHRNIFFYLSRLVSLPFGITVIITQPARQCHVHVSHHPRFTSVLISFIFSMHACVCQAHVMHYKCGSASSSKLLEDGMGRDD